MKKIGCLKAKKIMAQAKIDGLRRRMAITSTEQARVEAQIEGLERKREDADKAFVQAVNREQSTIKDMSESLNDIEKEDARERTGFMRLLRKFF